MVELPPAVAKYIADAGPFVAETGRAVDSAEKFDREVSKAALSARRMGLAAKEAGEKAAASMRAAAEGAKKAAKGMLKEEEAAKLAARAVRDLERAQVADAAAAIAMAEASDKAASAARKQAGASTQATKSATLMRSELVTLAAAGLAIAPAFVAAGGGVAVFGGLAVPTIKKVIDAQTKMGETWDGLSKGQKVAASSTRLLVQDYKAVAKALEPTTLKVYNRALGETASILPRLEPIARAGGRALLDFQDRLDKALDSNEAKQFLSFIESEAGPAMDALGDAMGGTAHLAASLVESLSPLATTGLSVIGVTTNLVAKLSDLDPTLAQLAVLGVGLRGPLSSAGGALGKLGDKAKAFGAASKGASLSTKALNLVTAAGPALYVAAGLALGYVALKTLTAKDRTDELVASMRVASRAFGNNIAGYEAMNRALASQLEPSTRRADAATKQLGRDVTANNLAIAQGADAARSLTKEWTDQAKSDNDKKLANIRAGAAALGRQYDITANQAISLADAVGVDMSKGILKNGAITATAAAQFEQYRSAVELANDPTRVVSQAWEDAANSALGLDLRVKAVTAALDAYLNPALGVLGATNQVNAAFAATDKALKSTKTTQAERSRQLETDLGALGKWISAEGAAKRTVQLTDAAVASHLPALTALARGNEIGEQAVRGLGDSLGGTITRVKGAIIATDRFGHAVKILPSGKVTRISADTAQAQIRLANLRALLAGIHSKTINIGVKSAVSGAVLGLMHAGARGGMVDNLPRRAGGGMIEGPGTETSDSVLLWGSRKEYVVNAKETRKHLPLLEAINAGKFARGGQVGYASGGQVGVGGVFVSAAQLRSLGQQLGKDFLKTMSDGSASQIASLDSRLDKAIAKLFGGKRTTLDNKLIAYLDKSTAKLETLAKQRDSAAKALAEAKEFAGTLTGNARSFAGLGGLESPMNAGQIRQGLTMRLSSLTRYASVIKALGQRGLSKSLLRQVLEMGPDEGLRYGEMLLGADKTTFSQINSVQKQIDATTTAFGRAGADALYDAGKHAGDGFLAGLQASLKSLDKEMDKLAKKLAASLKKSLKIKSPSVHPEIRAAGRHSVGGIAGGMVDGLPALDRAAALVAARIARPRIRPAIVPLIAHPRGPGGTQTAGGLQPITEVRVFIGAREVRAVFQSETLRYGRRNGHDGLTRAS